LSEFKNIFSKVCATPWITAKGKEVANLAAVQIDVLDCTVHTWAVAACFALPADSKPTAETEVS